MTTSTLRGAVAIAGVADEVSSSGEIDVPLRTLEARVIKAALDDAGIEPSEVDGLCSCTGGVLMHSVELAEQLGLRPSMTDATQIGGASYGLFVQHAAAAIAAGVCETVVVSYAATPRSSRKQGGGGIGSFASPERLEWEAPYGIALPIGAYALAASRHMAMYGTTPQQLASIAVDTRRWAMNNPRAYLRDPISLEEVLDSSVVAEPIHRAESCLVSDGAAAFVLTRSDRARDLVTQPAYVLGTGVHATHASISQMRDLTETPGVESGRRAFAMAGMSPGDVDVVELYDSFTITVLLALEDLGFCEKGEGGPFVQSGCLRPGGSLPGQTSGGGLGYTHPGSFGAFLLVEAVRQLRGNEGSRQVKGARTALAHGCGGVLSATSTVLLGTEV
jgi:acetyl-CoA acetyltransferase